MIRTNYATNERETTYYNGLSRTSSDVKTAGANETTFANATTIANETTVANETANADGSEGAFAVATPRSPLPVYTLKFETAMGNDVMPVGAYGGPHSAAGANVSGRHLSSMVDEERFKLFSEMGLNYFTSTLPDDENIDKFLRLCDKYKMGAFLSLKPMLSDDEKSAATSAAINERFNALAGYNGVLGFFLRDEPAKSVINRIKPAVTAHANSAYADSKYAYTNALPEWATDSLRAFLHGKNTCGISVRN